MTAPGADPPTSPLHEVTARTIDGKSISLGTYKGKVLLIVNVASRCGYTKQYSGLEELQRTYHERGFAVLGFPANNFRGQEPGSDAEIKDFCTTTFGVTFDMFSKISVAGDDQHPLYRILTSSVTNPEFAGELQWNFTKFLIGRDGKVLGRFAPSVEPTAEVLTTAIESALL